MSSKFNVYAKPYYPCGALALKQQKEKNFFDNLERIWWKNNKAMFDDSFEGVPLKVIPEEPVTE